MSDKNSLPTGKHTLVEEGTELKGTLSSKCPIVVMGKVEGDITGPVIHVTGSGVLAGNVKVTELRSAGEVAGEIEADSVQISGKVRDKTVIRARALDVALVSSKGGMEVLFGDCELAIGEEPDKDAAIAAAIAAPPVSETETRGEHEEDPAKDDRTSDKPRRGPSETWDVSGADSLKTESMTEEEATGKRRRGTLPPPQ